MFAHIVSQAVLAQFSIDRLQEVFSGGFIDRFTSDTLRMIVCIVVALIVAWDVSTVDTGFEKKSGEKFFAKLAVILAVVSVPGVIYLTWRFYSFISGFWRGDELQEPLLTGEPAPSSLWSTFFSMNAPWTLAAVIVLVMTFRITKRDPFYTRILASLGAFAVVLLLHALFF